MTRIQLALDVDDLQASISFYSALFGTEPAKVRPGYANFAVADPPLKLVLIESPGRGGTLNHLGVEVADVDAVDSAQRRLAEQGLATLDERGTTCCYARQDKFWVDGTPDGERWEIYTVLADSATFDGVPVDGVPLDGAAAEGTGRSGDSGCCGSAAAGQDVQTSTACCKPAS